MTPMRGARKTANELRTVMKVAALLISCHGCTTLSLLASFRVWKRQEKSRTQQAINVMKAPRRMSI